MRPDRDRADEREAMLRTIARNAYETRSQTGRSAFSDAVMEALRRVPRHAFTPDALAASAYEDRALPIGRGQTLSQPYMVALMTDLAGIGPDSVVLEIGTGSGYQAAVLAELARQVYSIELDPQLAEAAGRRLRRLGYTNVETRAGDGFAGWPEHAPFDAILVTAAAEAVPPPLVAQLADGGRMLIPLDAGPFVQDLTLLTRRPDGSVTQRAMLPVMFVRFRRGSGAPDETPQGM